jgi:hypothetical protein
MSVEPEAEATELQAILLPIPEEDVPRVLEAIKTMDADADVAGYAIGGTPVKGGPISGTGCKVSYLTQDLNCTDSDRS